MHSLHPKTPLRNRIVLRLTPLAIARKTDLASTLKPCSCESNPSVSIRAG